MTFDDACSMLEAALEGTARGEIVSEAAKSPDLGRALVRLRDSMRTHVWKAGGRQFKLNQFVAPFDAATRAEGFHALHDWDGVADKVNEDGIAVDVLHFLIDKRGAGPPDREVMAILLDYYFLYLLALLSLRIWDGGDADAHLDRVTRLVQILQGQDGSGHQFVANAETLMLVATSHYEPHEHGYVTLLGNVRALNRVHRTEIALVHASSMGSHLRFGFEATYGRDLTLTRDDNVADYPWLCFAVSTLMADYARLHAAGVQGLERDRTVEAILNGFSPDAAAFLGKAPASLSAYVDDRSQIRDLFHAHRQDLIEEFAPHRPTDQNYSPLAFFFNFAFNALKGTVVDTLLWGEAWDVTLNDLLSGLPREDPDRDRRKKLAVTLMGYARAHPDRIRGKLMPVIVYDPQAGRSAFMSALRVMNKSST